MDISRWCKPPVPTTKCGEPRQGDGMIVARFPQPRPGLGLNPHDEPVVCSRRGDLMSNVPSGQVAAFPAPTLERQYILDIVNQASDHLRRGVPAPNLERTML